MSPPKMASIALLRATIDAYGTVDILVNNAAIASGLVLRPFEKISRAEFERMLAVNTIGPFLCIRLSPRSCAPRSGVVSST